MISVTPIFVTLLMTIGVATADWRLIVNYDGIASPYIKNGLTNSGCTVLPHAGSWATWFDYVDNSYTDTVCFWNKNNCSGTKWCYKERDSGNVGAKDFRSYSVY